MSKNISISSTTNLSKKFTVKLGLFADGGSADNREMFDAHKINNAEIGRPLISETTSETVYKNIPVQLVKINDRTF